jgi:hypothetical protein
MATTATPGHANAAISVGNSFPVHAAIKPKQANGADGKAFLNGKPVVKTATPPAKSFVLPAPFGHYFDVLINLYLYPAYYGAGAAAGVYEASTTELSLIYSQAWGFLPHWVVSMLPSFLKPK